VSGICPDSNYTAVYGTIPEWNTAEITSMARAFEVRHDFNGDLSRWQGHTTSHIDTVISHTDAVI
jgi:hypothetical protein